jgi:hypothetical protein
MTTSLIYIFKVLYRPTRAKATAATQVGTDGVPMRRIWRNFAVVCVYKKV